HLGSTCTYMEELWRAYEGLGLAKEIGLPPSTMELELDSDVVIRSLQGGALGSVQGRASVRKIRRLAGGWLGAD
ncbi:hypothetical protein A2U01_0080114, partial [Trifolium medium]|nr:hypothetical protein [Trifolium medium]